MIDDDLQNVFDLQDVIFVATICLTREQIEQADGDVAQAVQNEVGHSGVKVIEIEDVDPA